jgi:8-oxo-dGTP diphosphatase
MNQTSQQVLVGVGVLVFHQGLVLLGKRKGSHGAGTWAAPGGHLEFGESVEGCAHREVAEETGLVIEQLHTGPLTNNVFAPFGKRYLTTFVIATCASSTPKTLEPDKCEGWEWFAWDALPEPLFAPLASLQERGFVPAYALSSKMQA